MSHLTKDDNLADLNDPMSLFNFICNYMTNLEYNLIKRNKLMKETNKLEYEIQSMSNQSKKINEKYEEREKWIEDALVRAENILITSQKFINKLNTDFKLVLDDYKKLPAFECAKDLMQCMNN